MIQIENESQMLERSGFAFFPIDLAHTYKCIGPSSGKLLIMLTPGGYEHFFRALDAAAKKSDLTPEILTGIGEQHGIEIVGPPIS